MAKYECLNCGGKTVYMYGEPFCDECLENQYDSIEIEDDENE